MTILFNYIKIYRKIQLYNNIFYNCLPKKCKIGEMPMVIGYEHVSKITLDSKKFHFIYIVRWV
ncbi:hypothetical protein SULI_12655 [Saccharolobus solfataricus]|nr:hypothetical protein SULG_12655 [Saccharolobus solfataricus]AZF71713.1 hypothetical protein SULH_12655 [Saccharolobus solfataricus]AZF74333.1 hypothetical protein SULI_12655 [Saccharolobus solfataricus]AZF76956.1 hypothetical protein SULM_12645 [Saccharolobus solfataricus]AZF82167.1 hypothetical protein SULO_12655 [Saccharolobus solfataricus]